MKLWGVLLFCGIFFSGCEKVKNAFGLSHNTPNELALMEQPDLIVPPFLYEKKGDPIRDAGDILKGKS